MSAASILQARHEEAAHSHGSGLTEAEQLETLRDPYASAPKYAWITAVVIGSIIALFGLANLSYLLRRRYPGLFVNSWYARKKTASWRYLASKQQRLQNGRLFQFPVLGSGLIMLAFFLFMFGESNIHFRQHRQSLTWCYCSHSMDLVHQTLLLQSLVRLLTSSGYSNWIHGS